MADTRKDPACDLESWLAESARRRKSECLERQRRVLAAGHAAGAGSPDGQLINFSSNDYLGLAAHPDLVSALQNAAQNEGVGSGASALVSGYREQHRLLETELADFLQREKVLLCSSGYLANLAVATSLASRGDTVIQDRLCHASLIDAAKLSGARLLRYAHADPASLKRRLTSAGGGRMVVVSDGVFSMDGDTPPLADMAGLCRRHGAWLVIDDAHGIGVCGPGGRGSVAAAGLDQQSAPVLTGTLGKAFGCAGAFIAGSEALIDHLVNTARSYIYTTAMPPALAAAARAALRRVKTDDWRRESLRTLIRLFRQGATELGLQTLDSDSPIQPVVIGGNREALRVSSSLREQGFLVVAMRPPTVREGTARLRITLNAEHEPAQVRALLEAIKKAVASA